LFTSKGTGRAEKNGAGYSSVAKKGPDQMKAK